jgi:hypothetical protein
MARKKVLPEGTSNELDPTLLTSSSDAIIPRIKLGATGFVGLKTTNGYVIEEPSRAFRFPAMLKVVDEMRNNPTVATALSAYRLLMKRASWDVEAPIGASAEQIEHAKFIKTCLYDMDDSWANTVSNWFDYLEYGSHVSEKVFRRRLRKNGSKFDDGLVGLKCLSPRSRSSIQRWDFSDDGRELLGVEQTLRYMDKAYLYSEQLNGRGYIYIPRDKFLLFTADGTLGNPEGNSILKAVYLAYKQLSLLQDQELLSVAKSVQGILKITAPPRYFDPAASEGDKAVLAGYQAIINNYNAGTQRGLLVPAMTDPETKTPMFTYELMSASGQQQDLGSIIKRLQGDILTALNCDILKMGMDAAGSFSIQDGDSNILALSVTHRLQEIADVLNHDLVPQLFKLNGWTDSDLPKIVPQNISPVSLEEHSKWVQRVFSVGGIEVDRGVLNKIRVVGGFDELPEDEPVDIDNLSTALAGKSTSAGKGMAVGVTGDGTAKKPGGNDKSASNADNKA